MYIFGSSNGIRYCRSKTMRSLHVNHFVMRIIVRYAYVQLHYKSVHYMEGKKFHSSFSKRIVILNMIATEIANCPSSS
jgi:hypothetical protein